MKKKLLAFILSLALLVSCFVPSVAVSAADSVANISDSTIIPGKTLWSFDGASVSAVPAGWEVERGTGTASQSFWGSLGVSSLSYNATSKAVKVTVGGADGILYFPEIDGDDANFIYEVTFTHLEGDSSVGLANNITLSAIDTDKDGLCDPNGATWFAAYEENGSKISANTLSDGYYIRKGDGKGLSKAWHTYPEGYARSGKDDVSTYKMVVLSGVTYVYLNGHLLTTASGEGFADPNSVTGEKIRVGMFLTSSAVEIKSASVKEIAGRSGIWDGKTTKQPTSDADGDGYTDITNANELAYVIGNGGSSSGKYELTADIWLNDMKVEMVAGSPKVTKASTGEEITDLSTLNRWFGGKTVYGTFKGNGHIVHGLFYNDYSETADTTTRALFPKAGKELSVSGFGVEDAYITSNSIYATAAIVGQVWGTNLTIDSCYAGESVYMYGDNLAGILGGGNGDGGAVINISNCYSLATFKHHDNNLKDSYSAYIVNAIVGNNWGWSKSSISNCYAVCDVGLTRSGTPKNSTLISTANASSVKGIAAARKITDIGDSFVTTEGYPTLKIFLDEIDESKNIPLDGVYKGSGTQDDPYIIENATQLYLCVGMFGENKYYKLANDIYVNDTTKINWSTGAVSAGYEPTVWFGSKSDADGAKYKGFASAESTFTGYIDGNGYAVSGIYYRPFSGYDKATYGFYSTCAGLIPTFEKGYVKNLVIKNSYISTGRFAGAITSRTLQQVIIENVAIDSSVCLVANNAGSINAGSNYGSAAMGGMIGYVRNKNNTTIKNSGFAGKVITNGNGNCFGMVGTIWNSSYTIENCFSVGIAPVGSLSTSVHGNSRNITLKNVYSNVAPSSWITSGVGTVNGTVTVVSSVTGADALSNSNMANLDKTVWYAVNNEDNYAPMLRLYGTNIGDVDENGKGKEVADMDALRSTLIGAKNHKNTDGNRDGETNICDLVAMHLEGKVMNDDWRSHPEDYKLLAFTFDDGPDDYNPSVTRRVADALAANNGSATFFFIGNSFNTDTDPDVAKYVLSKGSEIANHSYNHKNAATMDSMSEAEFNKEFEGANALIKEKTGVTPKYWRGGGYAYSERIYEKLEELNMPAIGCYYTFGSDWSGGSATVDEIVNTMLSGLQDGAIIGAHSSSNTYVTPDALEIALPQLYEQGYRFCTVSELLEYKGLSASDLPLHAYTTRIETLSDGSTKIHTMNRMYLDSWREHPEDYKLLAFTFDDGPVPAKDTRMVDLFTKYAGSATMFVTGTQCKNNGYESLQYAINNGWDIGNHSMTHADAHNGKNPTDPAYTELTYDQLKYQIVDMNTLLESNLKMADGVTPYEVSLYRPPQIRTTETLFDICEEENMPVIWLSQNTYDWSSAYDAAARLKVLKDGVGTYIDGDVILGHITQDSTYNGLAATLEAYYDAGYRFCSITELMAYRGIERSDISGKLNEVDGNQGRVRNLVKSATYGKAE